MRLKQKPAIRAGFFMPEFPYFLTATIVAVFVFGVCYVERSAQ